MTYGRSGSTLLQSLLNAIRGFRIYGENAAFLSKLQTVYEALREANHNLPNPDNDNESRPWFGASRFDDEFLTVNFRLFINRMLFQPHASPHLRVFGFKEIRFNELPHDQIEKYLNFVRKMFPGAAIVFNTRNVEDVLRSGWWRSNYWPGLPKQLTDFADFASGYVSRHADHAIHIKYDALIQPDRAEVHRLLDFFGETLVPESIDAVFRGDHSYENRALTAYITERCEFIKLSNVDWWRSNIEEFRMEIIPTTTGFLISGVFLPTSGNEVRLYLQAGAHAARICGAKPTPKIKGQFASNPAAGLAGFEIEAPDYAEMHLYSEADARPAALVGTVYPRRAAMAGGKGAGQGQRKEGAAKR